MSEEKQDTIDGKIDEKSTESKMKSEEKVVVSEAHDHINHNSVEKMIEPDQGPMAEELANEDEFVPNDASVIEVEVAVAAEHSISNKKVAIKKAQVKKFGWASLACLLALLPETVVANDDPVTNIIR